MMSTEAITDGMVFTEMVGDLLPPCFYDSWSNCGPSPATWAMDVRCGCGVGITRLACDGCHDLLVATEACITCPLCEAVHQPARTIFAHMERL